MKKLLFIFILLIIFTVGCAGTKKPVLSQGQIEIIKYEVQKELIKSKAEILADKVYKKGDLIKVQNRIIEAYEKQNKEIEEAVIENILVDKEFEEFFNTVESNWSIGFTFGTYTSTGSEGIYQDGIKYGFIARYKAFTMALKRIESGLRYTGQSGIDLDFNLVMGGFTHDFKPTDFGFFSVGFLGGIALPDYDDSWHYDGPYKEGLDRRSKKLADVNTCTYSTGANQFDKARVTFDPAPVLEINLNYTIPVKYGAFVFMGDYTYLSVPEDMELVDEPNNNGGWRIIDDLDCSGYTISINWKHTFATK